MKLLQSAFKFVAAVVLAVSVFSAPPASATNLIKNGTFEGATWANWIPDVGGTPVQTPFHFTVHTYLQNYPWGDTGCHCTDWITDYASQVLKYAPINPADYNGNVYVADASPIHNVGTWLHQDVSGLVVGQQYAVSFLQASGSYYNNVQDTAQWDVGLGGSLAWVGDIWQLSGAEHRYSDLMTNDLATGTSGWTRQTVTFVAKSSTQMLTFMATGSGAPPFALLADVSMEAVPEPSQWALLLGGFAFTGAALRRMHQPRRMA